MMAFSEFIDRHPFITGFVTGILAVAMIYGGTST
jgi:hypothetical protein